MSQTRTIAPVIGPDKTYIPATAVQRGYGVTIAGVSLGSCAAINAAGQRGVGICSADTAAGTPVVVGRFGDQVAFAGAAFQPGVYLKFDAAGRVVAVAGGAGSGEEVIGRAESSSTALGDEVVVFVSPFVL